MNERIAIAIRVIDQALAPLRRIQGAFAGLREQAARARASMGGSLQLVAGGAAGAAGLGALATGSADFANRLLQAGITANMTDKEIESLKHHLSDLSLPAATNQSMDKLLEGFTALVSAGTDASGASAALKAIGRTATATGAEMADLAKTSFVLMDALKIPPGALSAELDRLAFAGKAGAFELKDMAQYFPMLAPAVQALGLSGSEAVATMAAGLQMAKKGAGDPAEAANNMKNLLAKLQSKETKNNFEEAKIAPAFHPDKVIAAALKSGKNPLEEVLATIDKLLGKDVAQREKRMVGLFTDMQAQGFLRPMLANMSNYRKLKEESLAATGTVTTDYSRMMQDPKEIFGGMMHALAKLRDALGGTITPVIIPMAQAFGRLAAQAALFLEENPRWSKAVGWLATGMVGLALSVGGLGLAFAGLSRFWLLVAPIFSGMRLLVVAAASSLRVMATLLLAAGRALLVLGGALLANPLFWAIGLLAVAAFMIWRNWAPIKDFFLDMFKGIGEGFDWLVAGMSRGIEKMAGWLKGAGGAITSILPSWLGGGEEAGTLSAPARPSLAKAGGAGRAGKTEVGGTLEIHVSADGRPTVREAKSKGGLGFDITTGPVMVMP